MLEMKAICCKSAVVPWKFFDILISLKMAAFINLDVLMSSNFLILNKKSLRFLLARTIYIFIKYGFLEDCINFSQAI